MTIRKKMTTMLYENGLFEKEATAIIDHYLEGKMGSAMKGRMDDDLTAYPAALISVTWLGVKNAAVDWIDKNCPQHWARGMFE